MLDEGFRAVHSGLNSYSGSRAVLVFRLWPKPDFCFYHLLREVIALSISIVSSLWVLRVARQLLPPESGLGKRRP